VDLTALFILMVVLAVLGIILIKLAFERVGKLADLLFVSGMMCLILFLIIALTIALIVMCSNDKCDNGIIVIPIPIFIK